MTPTLSPTGEIINGDVLEILETLPDESVNCCVTSPPYWGLRDYGTATWIGGDAECDHRGKPFATKANVNRNTNGSNDTKNQEDREFYKEQCPKCGAIRKDQQLGLERTPEEYVARMVEIFREVRRVLRKDGTLWLNLGDSYVSGKSRYSSKPQTLSGKSHDEPDNGKKPDLYYHPYLKDKDLCGIPWRVAFALQADGWYLRQDIIWHKPNPMPESVTDRCTKAHEYVFLMSKSAKYYYDGDAVKEKAIHEGRIVKASGNESKNANAGYGSDTKRGFTQNDLLVGGSRNRRSVWTVTTKPFKEAHFATFPRDLIRPMIQAGCPVGGIVLDSFMGSGTTAIEAIYQDKRYIGIELNPAYVAMANNRIKDATRQMRFL